MRIGIESLEDLAAGSVFLGTGGGGDPYISTLLARQIVSRCGPVDLIHPSMLDDDAFVVGIGGIGAPSVGLELLPASDQCLRALNALEEHVGRRLDAVVPVEVGGANSLIPIVAAATKGLPVVDGDGMGRAFPEAQMTTFSISGVPSTPAVAVDYEGKVATFLQSSSREFEKAVRHSALSRGGLLIATEHPMSGRRLKETVVAGTMGFAVALGSVLRTGHAGAGGMIEALRRIFSTSIYGHFSLLHSGKIADIATRTVNGYDVGRVTIRSFDESSEMQIDVRNEFLVATLSNRIVAMVPDLITVTDLDTTAPINAERLRYGQQVSVFGIGCPDHYRTSRALAAVGPRAFGFEFDYRPLEELNEGRQAAPQLAWPGNGPNGESIVRDREEDA